MTIRRAGNGGFLRFVPHLSALAVAAMAGCDGPKPSVIVPDLSGVPAYTGVFQAAGGNVSWKHPTYAAGARMSPPMYVNGSWDSVILIRSQSPGSQTAEIDRRPLVTGQLRSASWTPGGCPQLEVQQVQLNGKSFGPFRADSWLHFTLDGQHWSLTGRTESGRVIYVDGVERLKLRNDDPRHLADWVPTADGGWQPAMRLTPTGDSGWTDLAGKSIPAPIAATPRKATAQVKLDNSRGPTTVTVNGSEIGTFAYVLSGTNIGPNGLAAKYGVDATGRLVMYAVDGEGQLVRLSIPQ